MPRLGASVDECAMWPLRATDSPLISREIHEPGTVHDAEMASHSARLPDGIDLPVCPALVTVFDNLTVFEDDLAR
jgi:hypothetical protein